MPLMLDDYNGMELMWNQLPKNPDADHVTLTKKDLIDMWESGIVDTQKYDINAWSSAFDGHKRPDGTFLLNKEEFLAKEPYRYKGEIMIPFDAMMINEGKYTDEGLNELFEASIVPSCLLNKPALKKFLDDLKAEFREKSSKLIEIRQPAKLKIKNLLDQNPSPLRRLEIIFDFLIKEAKEKPVSGKAPPLLPGELSAEQIAKIQASSFTMYTASDTEEKWKLLGLIEKKKTKRSSGEGKTGIALKKVKRSRKGIRG